MLCDALGRELRPGQAVVLPAAALGELVQAEVVAVEVHGLTMSKHDNRRQVLKLIVRPTVQTAWDVVNVPFLYIVDEGPGTAVAKEKTAEA
jgi:hypothetical protein